MLFYLFSHATTTDLLKHRHNMPNNEERHNTINIHYNAIDSILYHVSIDTLVTFTSTAGNICLHDGLWLFGLFSHHLHLPTTPQKGGRHKKTERRAQKQQR